MKQQLLAISAEFLKNKHSRIRWLTFVAFSLAPIFGSLFMILMKDSGYEGLPGAFKSKAIMFSLEANWASFLSILSQAVGIGGVLIFGFVISWLFGREYADGTVKDLLALPISRAKILNAKFIYYIIWCFALVLSNLILGLTIGFLLQLEGWNITIFINSCQIYFVTTVLIIFANIPIAFFALWGKGYLTPLGIVALLLVFAQIIGAIGLGNYFPWSVPGIYSGSGGEDLKMQLNTVSFISPVITGIIGYIASIMWWRYSDQK